MGTKHPINEQFFSHWSPDMAYVLGFFYADGSMIDDKCSRGKYIRFTNTDLQILEDIKKALASKHSIYVTKASINRKAKYVLSIGSKRMFSNLTKIGLATNKSLVILVPTIPSIYVNDFIRGYFDGDGCIHVEKQRKTLRLIFTSGSSEFLVGLSKLISAEYNIGIKNIHNSHRSFQLKYSQNEASNILAGLYSRAKSSLYLERKRTIFEKFLNK